MKRNFTHVRFSDKLKPLRIGPQQIIDRLSDVTYELLAQDGSTIHVHRNHLIPYYPKEPLLYPHLRSFMRFSDTTQFQIPPPTKYANSDSLTPPTNDNSLYKDIINTPHTNIPSDRSRHPSHIQTDSLPPLIDRTTKTTYKLRHQPKLDYRLFITPSKL